MAYRYESYEGKLMTEDILIHYLLNVGIHRLICTHRPPTHEKYVFRRLHEDKVTCTVCKEWVLKRKAIEDV